MAKTMRPTDAELEILQVLWDEGPSTVRAVLESIQRRRPNAGYTTVLKLMQIMVEKELLVRDESARTHVYRAKTPRRTTQKRLLSDLAIRAFGGSTNQLVLQALQAKKVTEGEIAEIRQLLDELEQGGAK